MLWLFRFFSFWPLGVLHALGGAAGWLVWALNRTYRARFRANVAQAGIPFARARPAIAEAGRMIFELPKLWFRPQRRLDMARVRFEGREHADSAFAAGRGVIFFGAHCGSFELGLQVLAETYQHVTATYRPARQAWLAKLEQTARERPGLNVVPASLGAIRLMLKTLKANHTVALLTDQVPPQGLGMWTPFFGRPAYSMTLAARLATQGGAAMLPINVERLPRGQGYVVKIWPRLEAFQADPPISIADGVAQINRALEKMILDHPGQYLWGYNRYKTPRESTA